MKGDGAPASALEVGSAGRCWWRTSLGDCSTLELPRVDHIIGDPPYSKDLFGRTKTNAKVVCGMVGGGRGDDARASERARQKAIKRASSRIGASGEQLMARCATSFRRSAKRFVILFHDDALTMAWRQAMVGAGFKFKRTSVWWKTDPMPQRSGDRPCQDVEYFSVFHTPGRSRWNGGGGRASVQHRVCKGKSRPKHPCPKPVGVMRHVIELFTDEGETVLDPFMGSGQTGLAALALGRNFVGVEIDAVFHAEADRRLREGFGEPA